MRPYARCLFACGLIFFASFTPFALAEQGGLPVLPHPILFVAQVPIPADFATIGSTFANHRASMQTVGRGGDLYIRYPDGTHRNLTREAGFGDAVVRQGENAIAVRDPSVHWEGDRALFSMVVGGPDGQFQVVDFKWQLYEVTGLGVGETAAITKIANQPEDFNNITPVYSPDGRILFSSDRPRGGEAHLYPQHDEYESTPTNTGLWSLDPATGDLRLLQHSPSGSFTPTVDSYGRVIFTRWDHLQRDQQADADALSQNGPIYGVFDYSDESAGADMLPFEEEVFPEPRSERTDLLAGTNLTGLRFNHFSPWQIRPDGTGEETLNHIGRHEMHDYFNRVFNDDPSLVEFIDVTSGRVNQNDIENFFQIREDPAVQGRYFGIDAPEFGTHASGMVIRMDAPPTLSADQMVVAYVTHPDTIETTSTPSPEHSGHYRDPLPLSDGQLIAAHTAETRGANNEGTRAFPVPRYDFTLKTLMFDGGLGHYAAASSVTSEISRRVEYWDPDVLVTWDGPLWQLQPVEVRSRTAPPLDNEPPLASPEQSIFDQVGVDADAFRSDLRERGLAVIVSHDVTTRDDLDLQQPFNLRVADTATSTTGDGGILYDVKYLQFFQADQLRGIGGMDDPRPGRRVLARPIHDPELDNPPAPGAPEGAVAVADDGSVAAFVPTRRALSWQLTAPDGTPVVRERYWLTFQPGEVRVCASCHGVNEVDQAGQNPPSNSPEALRILLQHWLATTPIFRDGFESGDASAWSTVVGGS